MLSLKSSLKGLLINVQNHTLRKLKHLCTLESVPISQSDKKETWLLGSYVINLLYSLHIPIATVVRIKTVALHIHPSEISRWKDTNVVSAVLL